MIPELPAWIFPLLALYPEIHYRFPFFPFSRYYRRQPEIIADAPRRLDPGQPLPLLLLIKDAHRFPLKLAGVRVTACCPQRTFTEEISLTTDEIELGARELWHRLIWIDLPNEAPAVWDISVDWQLSIKGRGHTIRNDNLPGLSHRSLQVVQSGYALPRGDGWHFGDLHVHTAYTADQVEFGAPLAAYPEMGRAQGLSFALTADHSYDLDDLPGSFRQHDPNLRRYHERAREISALNNRYRNRFALLPGFELSAGNSRGKNLHLLLLGQRSLLPGSGDSAERWFSTRPELSLAQALSRLDEGTMPVAAHPLVRPPLLERLLLRRGCWEKQDLEQANLSGLQIWNGHQTEDFQRGRSLWIEGLLSGRRWKIVAGSDAHGNFNRYRQVSFPMWKLREADNHVFGQVRTGVFLPEGLDSVLLLKSLQNGRSLVTDGPFADLEILTTAHGDPQIIVRAQSSPEFGLLQHIQLFAGSPGGKEERTLFQQVLQAGHDWDTKLAGETINAPFREKGGYIRAELCTEAGYRCLTNPQWLQRSVSVTRDCITQALG